MHGLVSTKHAQYTQRKCVLSMNQVDINTVGKEAEYRQSYYVGSRLDYDGVL